MKNILLYIWQLPQNLLGLIVRVVTQSQKSDEGNYHWKYHSGLSLGNYVFVNERASLETIKHEKGHQKQSLYLGPIYLLVIGLPSFTWASLRSLGFFKSRSYYSFYTEKWADRLAGVKRD